MKNLLIISNPDSYAAKRLVSECEKLGVKSFVCRVKEAILLNPKKFDALYVRNFYADSMANYLPQVVALAKLFKKTGKPVVDDVIASGGLGQGKWVDYQSLKKTGIPIPRTVKYELRIMNYGFKYPMVLKWQYGMKAKGTFLIHNQNQLNRLLPLHPENEWMIQEFIKAKYEYKVITVGYKLIPVALRFKMLDSGFRPDFNSVRNVPIYGPLGLPINRHATKLVKIAQRASKLLGRELSKVDILEDYQGRLYILEANRFPGFESFEKLTKVNVAGAFAKYLAFKLGT